MNTRELLIDCVNIEDLSEKELDYLEMEYEYGLENIPSTFEPVTAPSNICDVARIAHGSYEITCVAAILDNLRPNEIGKIRREKVLAVLFEAGLVI